MDFLASASMFFSDNPTVFLLQAGLLLLAALVVFLVLFAARDILLRTDSFLIQVLCILLVAALPIVGFFLYLIVRPSMTLTERRLQGDVEALLTRLGHSQHPKKPKKS